MIHDDKPDLPTVEEALTHYGVAGMKWGHRKTATGSQIHRARTNTAKQRDAQQIQQEKTNATSKGTQARAKESKKLADMKASYLKNPDRVIAARMTRGEKSALAILSILALPVVPAAAVAGAGIAATSARSRRIEQLQDKN